MRGYEHLEDTIEAYVAKKLSKQESEALEQRMLVDEGLRAAVAMERSLSSLVFENDLLQLNKKVAANLATIEKRAKMKRTSCAVLALVALSSAFFYFFLSSTKGEQASLTEKVVEQKKENETLPSKHIKQAKGTKSFYSTPKASSTEAEKTPASIQEVSVVAAKTEMLTKEVEKKEAAYASQENEMLKKEFPKAIVPTVPCSDKKIEATFLSKACQKNQLNGSIEVQLSSTWSHLQYSLDKHLFTPHPHFKHLSPGEYNVYAKEGECIVSLGIATVKATLCSNEYEKTYSPDLDPLWPIPIMEGEAASFKIVDKTGNVVFESSGYEPSGTTWGGNTFAGGPAALGIYKVFLLYPSGESCVNSVTLFR